MKLICPDLNEFPQFAFLEVHGPQGNGPGPTAKDGKSCLSSKVRLAGARLTSLLHCCGKSSPFFMVRARERLSTKGTL